MRIKLKAESIHGWWGEGTQAVMPSSSNISAHIPSANDVGKNKSYVTSVK